ncbi:MAG: S41 family peptidase [Planctomycetota bacterium]
MRALCLVVLLAATLAAEDPASPPMLPFDGLQWRQRAPFVRIDGEWYELLGAEGVPIGEILTKVKKGRPQSWQTLFEQQFLTELEERGVKLGPTMLLELREPGTGERIKRREEMTLDNFAAFLQLTEEEMFPDRVSPFDFVEWIDGEMHVEIGEHEGLLVSVNRIAAADLIAHCKKEHGESWRKAMLEEFAHLIAALDRRPKDNRVDLVLDDKGTRIMLAGIRMTYARREGLRHRVAGQMIPRIRREHSGKVAPGLKELARHFRGSGAGGHISAAFAYADLEQLEWLLTHRHATHGRTEFDLGAALDTIRASIPTNGIDVSTFALQIRCLLTYYGDAQTQVTRWLHYTQRQGSLNVLAPVGDRWVCFDAGLQPVDKKHPFVVNIDGASIEKWIEATQRYVPKGTPALRRFATRMGVHMLGQLRQELGIRPESFVLFTLDGKKGETIAIHRVETAGAPVTLFELYPTAVKMLPGNIAHVPIRRMTGEDELLAKLHGWAAMIQMMNGVVFDLRQNGGGSHRPILEMLPYFLPAGSPPRVIAVARERYAPGFKPLGKGPLTAEGFAPIADTRWSAAERAVLDEFQKSFKPAWKPDGPGSEWQYLVVSPSKQTSFDRPIVVLIDEGTMGSAEVAAGALKGLPNVTFVGAPTAGSHAPQSDGQLHYSRIHLQLPIVTVYRPDGVLFTGASIEPDVTVKMRMSDWMAETDIGLETALRVIAEKTPR